MHSGNTAQQVVAGVEESHVTSTEALNSLHTSVQKNSIATFTSQREIGHYAQRLEHTATLAQWGILFSHPRDFTPVCTTELACAAKISDEFKKRDVKMIALSIDSVEDHLGWSKDVMALHPEQAASPLPFPIIADDKRELSVLLGMLDPDERDKDGLPLTARCVFVVGPDKKLKLSILYPATTGRNFTEILRVIDSLQLTAKKKVATPVDWKPGDEVMVIPSLSDEEAKKLFPAGFTTKDVPSGKKYLRYTPNP